MVCQNLIVLITALPTLLPVLLALVSQCKFGSIDKGRWAMSPVAIPSRFTAMPLRIGRIILKRGTRVMNWHTPRPKGTGILLESPPRITGSASPLKLNPLRYLIQRWFSPQSFTPFQKSVSVCPTVHFKPKYLVFWYLVLKLFTHKSIILWNSLSRACRRGNNSSAELALIFKVR